MCCVVCIFRLFVLVQCFKHSSGPVCFQLCASMVSTQPTILFFTFSTVFNNLHKIFNTLLWNRLCVRWVRPTVGYRYNKNKKGKKISPYDENSSDLFFLQISYVSYSNVSDSHVVHYILITYLSYNWKFVPFINFSNFPPPFPLPLVTTNLISFSVSLGF